MNIVIVEDSELVREQLTRLLSSEPRLQLVGVAAGEDEAVELLAQARPDAVLLDLALSPGSGLRVLERMRAAGNAARVLILSNNRDPALRAACLARGADGVFDNLLLVSHNILLSLILILYDRNAIHPFQ